MSARSETTTTPRHTTSTAPDTVPSTINQTSATGRSGASGDPGNTSYNSKLSRKARSSLEDLRAKRAAAAAAESSDSGSDYDGGGSSDEDGGSVSSAASSVGPSSPPGSSHLDSFVSGPEKKKVQVGHGIAPQKKEVASVWPDEMGEEDRLAMLKANWPDTYTELMSMTDAERKHGLKNVKINFDRKIRLKEAAEATTQGTAATTTTKPPLDDDVLEYWGNHYLERAGTALKSKYGYVTKAQQSLYARKALHDFIPGRYDGSTSTHQWSIPWKEDAKAAKHEVTIMLKTDRDKTMYRDEYWIPKHRQNLKGPNGEEVTTEQIVAHYDKYINPTEATLDRDHELCSQFSVFQNNPLTTTTNGKIFEFDTLTNAQLEMVKEMKAIADEGGTEAEIKQKWDQTFVKQAMPEVKITDTAVSFFNPLPGCILTGEMPDGTVVTYSCKDTSMRTTGQASAPTRRELMVDTSGPNPFYISEKELESAKDWESIKTAYDQLLEKRKHDEKEAATVAATAKAAAAKDARIRPVAAKNGATSLADVPTRDTTKGTDCLTWNGLDIAEWQKNGRNTSKLSEAAATSLYNRALTLAKFEHLRPAGTDDQTAVEIASWVADGQSSRLVGDYLKARDIPFDSAAWDKVTESKSRPETWTNQKIRDWATNSSALKDTKFKDSQALDRMNMLASAQKRWPCQSRAQSYKVGSAFTDQFYLMSHDDKSGDIKSWYPALQKTFSEKLKEVPSWTPTKDEVW